MQSPRPDRVVEKLSLSGATLVALAGVAASLLSGCTTQPTSPFENRLQSDLRRSVVDAARRELRDPDKYPDPVTTTRDDGEAGLGIPPDQLEEVKRMAGLQSYVGAPLPLGDDLVGQPTKTVKVSLERAVKTAVDRNIAVQYARIGPAVSAAQVQAAEAAFDWTTFTNLSFQNLNNPGETQSQTSSASFGLRRTMVSGGRLIVQGDVSYGETKPLTGTSPTNNPVTIPTAITFQYDQPLLRGFGSDVTQAEIRVARNAERTSVQTLRRDLMSIATDTEKTYWSLVQAYQDVLILERLFERGVRVRDQLLKRALLDANSAQIAQANGRVSGRSADVTQAQVQLALLSNQLKQLMNDPDLPLGSPVVLIPADFAIDQPIRYSLAESIRSALRYRPEVQSAIIAIDDASIRQLVARNARLPDLSLRLQAKFAGTDDQLGESLGDIHAGNFANYVMALAFEYPLGNRRAEADYRRRVLERMQTVLAYRNTVQTVVADVLNALQQVTLYYRLVDKRYMTVLSTAEALRVLSVEKEIGPGYTSERLELEFNEQERLAQAERTHVQALVQYNSALADLFKAMGTTLERNNIQFVVPTGEDALEGASGTTGWAGEPVLKVDKK